MDATEEPTYGDAEQAIEDGSLASSFHVARAVQFFGAVKTCSATQIDADSVITALHCLPQVGDTLLFWSTATSFTSAVRTVAAVRIPSGTSFSVATEDFDSTDSSGNHADIAVLTLSSPIARSTATMAFTFPGEDASLVIVGSGNHDDTVPAGTDLRQQGGSTTEADDGGFGDKEWVTDKGDSGGGVFHNSRLLGVTTGAKWDYGAVEYRGWNTNVAHHLQFILDAMGYVWPHNPIGNIRRSGPVLATIHGRTLDICSYACDKNSLCQAFNFDISVPFFFTRCELLTRVDNATIDAGFRSASK